MHKPFLLIFRTLKIRRQQANQINNISSITWGKCCFYTLLIPFVFIASCKNPDNIGLDVIPASDHLNTLYTDTMTVVATTAREDSLRSDEVSKVLLGSISDADFGVSTANLYTQVLLGETPSLGSNLSADSLVISFAYSGYYGDITTPMNVHVYRLNSDLHLDSSYYTNQTFDSLPGDLVVTNQFTPHPSDSVMVGSSLQAPQLRIRLTDTLAATLVSLNSQSQFQSNDNWKAYFKGFYIKIDPATGVNTGSVLYFLPGSTNSKMTLYYHADTVARSYDFTFDNAARVNHQVHDYTGTRVEAQLNNPSSNDTLSYIQSLAGLKTNISFPYFKNINSEGKILINKAELVVTVPTSTDDIYVPPSGLLMAAKDSAGGLTYLSDYLDPLISFGGTFSTTSNVYKFNIARHLQRILDGDINDYGFSINIISSVVQANRAIIGNGKQSSVKMKLNLFYTKL